MKIQPLVYFIAGILLSSLIIIVMQRWLFPPLHIVTFDMKKTTDRFLLQVSKLDLTDGQKDNLIAKYNKTLNTVLAKTSTNNTLVLVSSAVMAGAQDKTDHIQQQIAEAMKNDD